MNNYQFDSLKFATEGLTGGGCTIIPDVKGLPSFMIPINKRTNRSKTLADCLWQLQQHFERWPFRVELEQPTFERQDEHRLLLRLSF